MTRSSLRSEAGASVRLALLLAACRGGGGASPAPAASPATGAAGGTPSVDFAEVLDYARRASAAYQDEARYLARLEALAPPGPKAGGAQP